MFKILVIMLVSLVVLLLLLMLALLPKIVLSRSVGAYATPLVMQTKPISNTPTFPVSNTQTPTASNTPTPAASKPLSLSHFWYFVDGEVL